MNGAQLLTVESLREALPAASSQRPPAGLPGDAKSALCCPSAEGAAPGPNICGKHSLTALLENMMPFLPGP